MAVSFQQSHELAQAVDSVNSFGIAIYRELAAQQPGQSFFFSPSSIAFALAMTLKGAAGETADELAHALCGDCRPEPFHTSLASLFESTNNSSVELRLANRLWGQAGYEFLPAFLEATERYGARMAELDFKRDAKAARATINSWVSEQTRGNINELLGSGSVDTLTRLIVTNAAYFLGAWKAPFDEDWTQIEPFWVTSSESVELSLMHQRHDFSFSEFPQLKALEMSYRGGPMDRGSWAAKGPLLSMCVFLPNERDGLPTIEAELTTARLRERLFNKTKQVVVALPKFRVRSGISLRETLENLGVRRAFDPAAADFSNATTDPAGLVVSEVLHQAFVNVDEKGTEAAAATVVSLRFGYCAPPEPPGIFCADHPFLFLIRDRTTKLIHFMGRFTGA